MMKWASGINPNCSESVVRLMRKLMLWHCNCPICKGWSGPISDTELQCVDCGNVFKNIMIQGETNEQR